MKRAWNYVRQLLDLPSRPRTIVRRRPRIRPYLERLEDRTVPTVVYNSAFGGDTIVWGANWWGEPQGQTVTSPITNNPGALNDPTVYLIFWGKSWTQSTASQYASDAQTIIQSHYLSGLTDYGSDGVATYGGYTIDNSASSLGPVNATNEIDAVLPNMNSWAKPTQQTSPFTGQPGSQWWSNVETSPIYVVVTDASNGTGGNGPDQYIPKGTNDAPLAMNHIWINVGVNEDAFTDVFSHELVERMSAGGGGIVMNAQVAITNESQDAQIADNEPDGGRYTYRLDGSVLVQAYWSLSYQAFIVPNGTQQNFYIDPQWQFTGYNAKGQPQYKYTGNELVILGDQLGSDYNDSVTVDTTNDGGLAVTLNGETVSFDPYQTNNFHPDEITSLYVGTGGGANTINILSTPSGMSTYIDAEGYDDTVTVGNDSNYVGSYGSMANIDGSVEIAGGGAIHLNVDDSGDESAQTVTMYGGEIYYGGSAPVTWTPTSNDFGGVVELTVYGGSGANTFNVVSTGSLYSGTYLVTGSYTFLTAPGDDTTNVYGASGALYIDNPGGQDYTYVGLGYTGNINGWVDVYGNGSTSLYVDDSYDTTGLTVTMNDGYIDYGRAVVSWIPSSSATGGVTYLEVDGGSGDNTFNVDNTSNLYSYTQLNTGAGFNTVNVYAATGNLYVNNPGGGDVFVGSNGGNLGGTLGGINGLVDVYGAGSTSLYVDDGGDKTGRTFTMGTSYGTGYLVEGQADIQWTPSASSTGGGVTELVVYGGSGGNTFNVNNTATLFYDTWLGAGSGNDTVNIYATTGGLYIGNSSGYDNVYVGLGNMTGINGFVYVYGSGSTYLYLNDSNDTYGRKVTMGDGYVSGLGGGTGGVSWVPSSSSTGGVTYLVVDGGSGGNTFTVDNTSNFYWWTYLSTGTGNDTVNLHATTGALDVYNPGGTDALDVGLGSVAGINRWVEVYGSGSTALLVDDSSDGSNRTATLTNSMLNGLGNAGTIEYGSGVTSLTIDGGTKANTFNIQSTAAGIPVTIKGGSGGRTFNVANSNSLRGIQGALSVSGGGSNTLNINDGGGGSGLGYTLSSTQLTRSGAATITYASLAALNITAGGNDTLTLLSPLPTVATSFNGNSGTNTLQGANVSTTWTISGANSGKLDSVSFSNIENLVGGTANDTFQFTSSTASISTINGGGGTTNKLDYSTLGSSFLVKATLTSNTAGSAPLISGGFSGIDSLAGSADTANTLTGPNLVNLWTLSGANAGKVNTFAFTNMPHLVGGTNVDTFKFTSPTASKVTSINGGGAPLHQGDWLDYSSFGSTSTVAVNLATGSATNVSGGVGGIPNVIGSASGTNNLTGDSQGNILIGGSGLNKIVGGSGNSLLIGGSGHGSLTGGAGQDILIAGTTTYSPATSTGKNDLMAILAELQSADTFAQKVNDIIHGTNSGFGGSDLNGKNKLTWGVSGAAVKASSGAFALKGDTAAAATADWFFANASSTVSDFNDDGVKDEHNNNAVGVF